MRIEPDRGQDGETRRHDPVAAVLDLIIEIRLMLERVGV
jgi:hypothetical protein